MWITDIVFGLEYYHSTPTLTLRYIGGKSSLQEEYVSEIASAKNDKMLPITNSFDRKIRVQYYA